MSHKLSRRALVVSGLSALGGGLAAGALPAAEDKGSSKRALTLDTLGTTLKAMGFEAKKVESRYDFAFVAKHEEEWNLSMSAVLSTDEKSIWIQAWLDELPKSSNDVPRTALLRLLADNDKIGNGIFFAYVASVKRFVLQRVIRNEQISSATLKADLVELGGKVVDLYAHWNVAGWKELGGTSNVAEKETSSGNSGSTVKRSGASPAAKTAVKEGSAKGTSRK
ncbi:MAG: hypothetical protein ACKV0T_08220 [Planctomycetales bacterium]